MLEMLGTKETKKFVNVAKIAGSASKGIGWYSPMSE